MSIGAGGISSIQTPPGNPQFVRLDSKHACLVCKNVLREAMQTSCGHRICENCIESMFKGKSEPVPCPAGEEDCLEQCRADTAEFADIKTPQKQPLNDYPRSKWPQRNKKSTCIL